MHKLKVLTGTMFIATTVLVHAQATSSITTTPKVLWFASPVLPGETVLVYGDDWSTNATVSLAAPGKDGAGQVTRVKANVLQVRGNCISFVVPKSDKPQLLDARIESDGVSSQPMILNEPAVWWTQGDAGAEASPGGWLRLFGRCLDFDDAAQMVLKQGSRSVTLPLTHREMWSLDAAIPADLAAGDYTVSVHNGLGGDAGWRNAGTVAVRPHGTPWKQDLFDVTTFGAVRNDAFFDTPALQAALNAAKTNGGGIIYFPRGRYQLTGSFDVPPNTLLKGEGLDLSQIYWPDTDNPPDYLIKGGNGFGIQDLFIQTGHHMDGIVCQGATNVVIERVRMRLLRDQYVSREELKRRTALRCRGLVINAMGFRVEDCDIHTDHGCHGAGFSGSYGIVRNNKFIGFGGGGFRIDKMTYEHNTIHGGGHSMGPGRNMYWAHNTVLRNFEHDRESMTTDGGGNTYKGPVTNCDGTVVKLPAALAWRHGHRHWIGKEMIIMDGRGAGQQRRITDISDDRRTVTIDRPWTIEPDADSFVMIFEGREHMLFVENRIEDSTIALQVYGSMVEAVLAGNTSARTGGFHTYGMWKGTTPEPLWYVQHIGNRILEGNAYRAPQNDLPVRDAHIQVRDRGHRGAAYPFTRCNLIRRCEIDSNGHLSVEGGGRPVDTLIEDCVVRYADLGIAISSLAEGVILRGNRFQNVVIPFQGDFSDVWQHPADAALARLSCTRTALAGSTPDAWESIEKKLAALAKTSRATPDTATSVRSLMLDALRALNASGVTSLDADTADALLGLELGYAQHTFLPVLEQGGTEARMLGMFNVPIEVPGYTLSPEPTAPDGWTVRCDTGVRGTPGQGSRCFFDFKMPEGPKGAFRIPLMLRLAGDGWTLDCASLYRRGSLSVSDWLIVGPFENKSRENIDTTVHPPELKLDVGKQYDTQDGPRGYEAVKAVKGTVNLLDCFKTTDWSVAYAVAGVRASRAISVKVSYGGGMLLYVNGQPVGTRWRWNTWGCVELQPGDNVIQAISSHKDGNWTLRVDLEVIDPHLQPDELIVILGEDLKQLPALLPRTAAKAGPLPYAQGIDWKLIFEDDFSRDRIGDIWQGRASAGWMPSPWKLVDGAIQPESAFSTLAYTGEVKPPVRLEFDAFREGDGTRMLAPMLCPKGLSLHRFWGQLYGYGYLMCLGWHDDFSNSMMRNGERIEVQPGDKALQLAGGTWYHITAMFIPPRCLLYVDDALVFDYADTNWIENLNEVAIFSYPINRIDNVKLYEGSPAQ